MRRLACAKNPIDAEPASDEDFSERVLTEDDTDELLSLLEGDGSRGESVKTSRRCVGDFQ
jgi:hypothetical protein